MPGLQVEVFKVSVGIVGRDVDGLGNRGVHKRLHRFHHGHMVGGRHLQRRHKVGGQALHVATQRTVQAPSVVFHLVLALAAIGLAFAAGVSPGKRRLNAVGCVVREGQAHRARGRNRQQMAVANAVLANGVLNVLRQAAGKRAGGQVALGIELGKGAFFLRQGNRGAVGRVTHTLGNLRRHGAAFGCVVAQAQHGQGIAHAGEAHANTALGGRLRTLLLQGPVGHIQHVVQRAHLGSNHLLESVEIKMRLTGKAKGVAHKARQDDGPEVTAAVGRQGLLATRVGGRNFFAVTQVVVFVDAPQKQNAWLSKVVGRLHDGVPQLARRQALVHPQAIGALGGPLGNALGTGLGAVYQLPVGAIDHGLHELIAHAHRDVEIVPAPWRALGGDEVQHIGMVNAQHAHLRAPACARALYGGARLIEDVDVAARARGQRARSTHARAAWADARKVIAHPATTAHGFSGLAQGFVNAGVARIVHALDAVTHGLHKAVDQRGLDVSACGAHDAACTNGARTQVGQEFLLPLGAYLGRFYRGQRARHAGVELLGAGLAGFKVFLLQHIQTDGLFLGGRGVGFLHGMGFLDRGCGEEKAADRTPLHRRAGASALPPVGKLSATAKGPAGAVLGGQRRPAQRATMG